MNEKITILIADDNADFAATLVEHLSKENDMEVIGIAEDGKEACKKVENLQELMEGLGLPLVKLLQVVLNIFLLDI